MRLLLNSFALLNMLNLRKNNKLYETFFHNGTRFSTTIIITIVIVIIIIIIIIIISILNCVLLSKKKKDKKTTLLTINLLYKYSKKSYFV